MSLSLWPHQRFGIDAVFDAIDGGQIAILLTSPTGMGKSRMVCEIIERLAEHGWDCVLYTNRRPLIEQLSDVLTNHRIDFGVRAAGYEDELPFSVQISSIQTEISRVVKRQRWTLHGKGKRCFVVVDEAHLNDGPEARKLFALHQDAGHVRLGVTATPIDLGASYEKLIIAGSVSEGRKCGALVLANHYGPDEPDWKALKKKPAEGVDLTEPQVRSLMGKVGRDGTPDSRLQVLYGRVWDNFCRLNPDRKPTVLFAAGVEESIWFAKQFCKKGCRFAHIDGEHIWIDDELHRATTDLRREVFDGLRTGRFVGVSNRFVMREGIDVREIAHIILATVMGGLQTYLQSLGRGLRACPGKECLNVQDHGGNWIRHGSANEDRLWDLDLTASAAYGLRADKLRQKKRLEPFLCPQCQRVWAVRGKTCSCGFVLENFKKERPVLTTEGELRLVGGDVFRPHRITQDTRGPEDWERMYWRSRNYKKGRTFNAAFTLFAMEHNWGWPDRNWPLMPLFDRDVHRDVSAVPFDRLTSAPVSTRGGA